VEMVTVSMIMAGIEWSRMEFIS